VIATTAERFSSDRSDHMKTSLYVVAVLIDFVFVRCFEERFIISFLGKYNFVLFGLKMTRKVEQ